MGTKGEGRRRTRFHPGAKRDHFTGPTRGKRVVRGSQEERKQRKAKRKLRGKQTEEQASLAIEQGLRAGVRRFRKGELPPLPPIE